MLLLIYLGAMAIGFIVPPVLIFLFLAAALFGSWSEAKTDMLPILIFYFKLGAIPYLILVIFSLSSLMFQIKRNLIATKKNGKKSWRLRSPFKRELRAKIAGRAILLLKFPIFWIPYTATWLLTLASGRAEKGLDGLLQEPRTITEMIADSFCGRDEI